MLNESAQVNLQISDVSGQTVTSLFDGTLDSGVHQYNWKGSSENGTALSDGIYLYRLKVNGQLHTGRLMLMK